MADCTYCRRISYHRYPLRPHGDKLPVLLRTNLLVQGGVSTDCRRTFSCPSRAPKHAALVPGQEGRATYYRSWGVDCPVFPSLAGHGRTCPIDSLTCSVCFPAFGPCWPATSASGVCEVTWSARTPQEPRCFTAGALQKGELPPGSR